MIVLLPMLLFAAPAGGGGGADAAPQGRRQTFIAPSGEPFRVYGDVPYPIAQWFAGADKNSDGKLVFAEFEADFMRFFDQLDTNHDGVIDAQERAHYENAVAPETIGGTVAGGGGEDGGGKSFDPDTQSWQDKDDSDDSNEDKVFRGKKVAYGRSVLGAARYDLLGLPEPVAAMDMQVRGRISHNDAHDAATLRFNQLDAAHRGYLTLDSLPRTFAQGHGLVKHR